MTKENNKVPHEPKRKHSKMRKRVRRASIKLASLSLVVCQNCNQKTPSHMACKFCGFYAGKPTREIKQKAVVTRA